MRRECRERFPRQHGLAILHMYSFVMLLVCGPLINSRDILIIMESLFPTRPAVNITVNKIDI